MIFLALEKEEEIPMDIFNEIWEYYTSTSATLSSFSHIINKKHYTYGNAGNNGFSTVVQTHANSHSANLETYNVPMVVIVNIDKKTSKAKRVVFDSRPLKYKMSTTINTFSEQWNPDFGTTTSDTTEQKTSDEEFAGVLPNDPVTDPVTGSEYPPELDVTTGNGIKNLGGGDKKTFTYDSCHWYDQCIDIIEFRWGMTRDVPDDEPVVMPRRRAEPAKSIEVKLFDIMGKCLWQGTMTPSQVRLVSKGITFPGNSARAAGVYVMKTALQGNKTVVYSRRY
jgi:hypothetical protein